MKNSDRATEILEQLVAFDTVSRNPNLEISEYIAEYLEQQGVEAKILKDASGKKANVFATIGDPSIPGYVLSGHTDVVPIDGQDWSRDPFTLTREGDKLYGRGTTDMKGFVACIMAIVPRLKAARLQVPVHLAFSYDEEVGCLGVPEIIKYMDNTVARPRAAFIGEPSTMGVIDSHKGSCGLITEVTGVACHSSRVDLGVNAIFGATQIIAKLRSIAAELAADPDVGSSFEVPYSSVSVGVIRGGTSRNTIPGDCSFQWDIRATKPGVTDSVQRRISEFVEQTVLPEMRKGSSDASIETRIVYDVPPLISVPGSEAETLAKRFAGVNDTTTVNYGSEAGIFQKAGIASIICGPGQDSQAHIADEWIAVEQIEKCMGFLEAFADHVTAEQCR